MSFKSKLRKKANLEQRVTLQAKHDEKIEYFEERKSIQDNKREELETLKEHISKYNNIPNKNLSVDELNKKLELSDKIMELEDELNNDDTIKEDINYLLDTGSILFSYYNQMNEKRVDKKKKKEPTIEHLKEKTIVDFFQKKDKPKRNEHPLKNVETIRTNNTKDDNNFLKNSSQSKEKMYENYSIRIGDEQLLLDQQDDGSIEHCLSCGVERKLFMSDGKMICPTCGDEKFILIDSDKPSYKEPPRELSYFAYKRINHLNEWLAQFQAKESTDIPQEVYDKILLELKKERMDDISQLSTQKLREILKKLKLNKYYEHVPHIINRLNGVPPPTISREIEEELRRMFKEIQMPFHKFCPKDRKNFLSYSYVLHKFMQLLEMDEFLPCFMLLKSREKLHQQDQIWRKICEYLRWEFIPSV
jgi:uncharacterized Zn finger protein (UPF0148 family)